MPLAVSNLNLLFGLKELEEDEEDHTLLQQEVVYSTRSLVILYLFQKKKRKEKFGVVQIFKIQFLDKIIFCRGS